MASSEIEHLLLPHERVLWSGAPEQGIRFTSKDLFMIPFSILWGGFAIFWEVSVMTDGAPLFFRLWGIPFVVIGLYLMVGRFFLDAWARRNIVYAVTDRRVLINRKRPFPKLTAVAHDQIGPVNLVEEKEGKGTILFETPQYGYGERRSSGYWSPAFDTSPQLIGIDDARKVFAMVQEARQAARKV